MPIVDRSPFTGRPAYQMRRAGDVVVPAASDALVPVNPVPHFTLPSSSGARPDPTFMAHLMATAEQDPQTRVLRRAAVSDAQAAYRAADPSRPANRNGLRSNYTA
jgi:hypothetical protein